MALKGTLEYLKIIIKQHKSCAQTASNKASVSNETAGVQILARHHNQSKRCISIYLFMLMVLFCNSYKWPGSNLFAFALNTTSYAAVTSRGLCCTQQLNQQLSSMAYFKW